MDTEEQQGSVNEVQAHDTSKTETPSVEAKADTSQADSGTDEGAGPTGFDRLREMGKLAKEGATKQADDKSQKAPLKTDKSLGVADQYTPNFKFKVKDKDLEFDEWVKPHITSKEVEDKYRDIFEKAHGIEEVKLGREKFKNDFKELSTKYGGLEKSVQAVAGYVQNGDFDSFCRAFNVPEDKIIGYAIQKLKERELPQEQRQALDQQRTMQRQLQESQWKQQQTQQDYVNFLVEQKNNEFNIEFSRPEISQLEQQFDARVGKPGAFRNAVIERGEYYERTSGQLIPVRKAVDEIIAWSGLNVQQAQAAAPQGQMQVQQAQQIQNQMKQQQVIPPQQKPVIPNLKGTGTVTPVKKVFNSIDEIRAHREQMYGNQN